MKNDSQLDKLNLIKYLSLIKNLYSKKVFQAQKVQKMSNDNDIEQTEKDSLVDYNTDEDEFDDESEGRDWRKLLIAVVFVLIVIILWYTLTGSSL